MPEQPPGTDTLDARFLAVYAELRGLGAAVSRGLQSATLNPAGLVNEAYLKLASSQEFETVSPLHFKRIAARAMRQVLCDAARRRLSVKRGGEDFVRVPLGDDLGGETFPVEQLVIVDELIEQLRALNPRQAAVVECRFFGGLGDEEIAGELGVSRPTVERDWRAARAWLSSQMS